MKKWTNAVFLVLALLAAGAFGGCSANVASVLQSGNFEDTLAALKSVTVADLDAATARAIAGGDALAAQCYPVLKKYVQSAPDGKDKVAGLVDAFEKARLLGQKASAAQIPQDLQIACAPLFADQAQLNLKIGNLVRP